jgi:membrane protein DedA with SNARE-associated domain
MDIRGFLSDIRHSFRRPAGKSLLKAVLPIVGCLALAVAMSLFLQRIVDDPEQFADDFADDYGNYVYVAIFFICFFSSLTILLPAPGTLVIMALVALLHLNPVVAAIPASIGGSLGEISAYWVGYSGRAVIDTEHSRLYQRAESWTRRHGGRAIAAIAFFPFVPFDLAGIAAGALKYPWNRFLFFCWCGRFPRNIIECSVAYFLGYEVIKRLPWM